MKLRILSLLRSVESLALNDLRAALGADGEAAVTAARALADEGQATITSGTVRIAR